MKMMVVGICTQKLNTFDLTMTYILNMSTTRFNKEDPFHTSTITSTIQLDLHQEGASENATFA